VFLNVIFGPFVTVFAFATALCDELLDFALTVVLFALTVVLFAFDVLNDCENTVVDKNKTVIKNTNFFMVLTFINY